MTEPSLGLGVNLRLTVQGEEYIDKTEQKRWNVRNANRWSMVSTVLVENGEVNDEKYARWSSVYERFTGQHNCSETDLLSTDLEGRTSGKGIWSIGLGQRQDLKVFVPHAHERGYAIKLADHSKVACQDALTFLGRLPNPPTQDQVVVADIIYVLEQMVRSSDMMLNFGRIWHHLPPRKLRKMPKLLGEFLAFAPELRRITYTHPNFRHNKQWLGRYKSVKRVFDVEDYLLPGITKAAGGSKTGLRAEVVRAVEFDSFEEHFTTGTIMLVRR